MYTIGETAIFFWILKLDLLGRRRHRLRRLLAGWSLLKTCTSHQTGAFLERVTHGLRWLVCCHKPLSKSIHGRAEQSLEREVEEGDLPPPGLPWTFQLPVACAVAFYSVQSQVSHCAQLLEGIGGLAGLKFGKTCLKNTDFMWSAEPAWPAIE